MQDCSNSIGNTMKLLQSCTKWSICNDIQYGATHMMMSSNGNIFHITGPLCGAFGYRWIPSQRPVTRSFDVFFDPSLSKQYSKQHMSVIGDAIVLIMTSL